MKARILYVIDNLEFGGGERLFLQLAEVLKGRYEVFFTCQPGGLVGEKLSQLGVPLLPIDFHGQISLPRITRLVAMLKQKRIHLVHSMGARADFSARLAARLAGVPVIVSTIAMLAENYDVSRFKRWLYRIGQQWSEQLCDGFIAVSDAVRKVLAEDHHIPVEKVTTIHNIGVELDLFCPSPQDPQLKSEIGLDPTAPVIGTVGRLVYQKAQGTFLEAASRVVQAIPDAQFLIVGEGPLRSHLEQMAVALGLQRCHFTGFRADVPRLLQLMDVFALSSILEGFPQVLLEALAAARPTVATSINGVTEVIRHGTTGLLVPPRDPSALAEAIIVLLKNQGLARRLGEAGRKLVEEQFAMSRMAEKVDQLYTTLLRKKGVLSG